MNHKNNPAQLKIILVILALAWLLAAIKPYDRSDWLLENLLVFVSFGALLFTYKKFQFSLVTYWLFATFMCLHLYGSHYTYAQAPLGFLLQDVFDLSRNHYDRIVHFSFGLLITPAFMELLHRTAGNNGVWLILLSLALVLSFSAIYEQIEMLAAMIVHPELGMAFLGTQGDEWDAQKDTGLAFAGAILSLLIGSIVRRRVPPIQ